MAFCCEPPVMSLTMLRILNSRSLEWLSQLTSHLEGRSTMTVFSTHTSKNIAATNV